MGFRSFLSGLTIGNIRAAALTQSFYRIGFANIRQVIMKNPNNDMRYKKIIGIAMIASAIIGSACSGNKNIANSNIEDAFVTVKDGEFYIGDSVYRYVCTNFWYGAILASAGKGGNRERLARELDTLQAIGINNLRILVGGDGDEGLA